MSDLNIDELIEKFGKNYPDWLNRSLGIQIATMDKTLKQIYGEIDSVEKNVNKLVKNSDKSLAEDKKTSEAIAKVNGTLEKISKDKATPDEIKKVRTEITKLGKLLEKANVNDSGLQSEIGKLTKSVEKIKSADNSSLEKTLKTSMGKLQKSLDKIANGKILTSNISDKGVQNSIDNLTKTIEDFIKRQNLGSVRGGNTETSENMEELSQTIEELTKKNKGLMETLKKRDELDKEYNKSLKTLNSDIQSMSKSISNSHNDLVGTVDRIGNKITGVLSSLPSLFGTVLGGLAGATTAGLSLLTDEVLKTQRAYSQLSGTGIMLNDGFIGIRNAATAGSMSLQELTAAMTRNTSSFIALGTDSGRIFSTMTLMAIQTDSSFRRLGMTTEQINEFLSDNLEYQRLGGRLQRMSDAERSARADQEVRRFASLSAAFGVSIEDIQRRTTEYATGDEFGVIALMLDRLDPSGGARQELLAARETFVSMRLEGPALEAMTEATAQQIARRYGGQIPSSRYAQSAAITDLIATPQFTRLLQQIQNIDPNSANAEQTRTDLLIELRNLLGSELDIHELVAAVQDDRTQYGEVIRGIAGMLQRTVGMETTAAERSEELQRRLNEVSEPALQTVQQFENTIRAINAAASEISTRIITLDSTQQALTTLNTALDNFATRLNETDFQGSIDEIINDLFGDGVNRITTPFTGLGSGTLPSFDLSAERLGWALAGWRLGGPIGAALAFALGPSMNDLMGDDITRMIADATPLDESQAGWLVQHGIPLLSYMYAGFMMGGPKGAVMGGIAYVSYAAISGAANALRDSSEQTSEDIYNKMPNMEGLPEGTILTQEQIGNIQGAEHETQRYFGPNRVMGSPEAINRATEVQTQARNAILEQARRAQELGVDHGINPEYLRRMQLENLAQGRNFEDQTDIARYLHEARQSGFIDEDVLFDNVLQGVLQNFGISSGSIYSSSLDNISRKFENIISGIQSAQQRIADEQARISRSETGVDEYGIFDLGSLGGNEIYGRRSSRQTITSQTERLDDLRRRLEELRPLLDIFGIEIPQLAAGGVAVGSTLANIAEASSPEMVLPLDPSLHDMAKYIAEQHVEIVGPMYRRLNNELIYRLFRENDEPIDRTFTKSLDKFFFSKSDVETVLRELKKTDEVSITTRDAQALMNAMGIFPEKYMEQYTGSPSNEPYYQGGVNGAGAGHSDNASAALDFFISKGYSIEQAAGLVGNLQAESGKNLNIRAVGDGGKAYGIAQWHPDRQAKFKQIFGKDIRQSTFEEQLNFVAWELENSESKAGRLLRQATTAEESAFLVDKYYERSAGLHTGKRIANANALLQSRRTPPTPQRQPLSFGAEQMSFPSEFLPMSTRQRQPLSFGSEFTSQPKSITPVESTLNKLNDELIKVTAETNELLRRIISRQDTQTIAIKNSGGVII